LKTIGKELKLPDLEYYAARHSWATIALNKCKIDKYTVHAALNHVDESMRVTDIYIERDFVNENKANQKVIKYVFG
jgi:integrase